MTVREPVEYTLGVALAKASATSGEIRPCERGWRAAQRANDRLTPQGTPVILFDPRARSPARQ